MSVSNTLESNYAPSVLTPNYEGQAIAEQTRARQSQILSAVTNLAASVTTPGQRTPGNLLSGAATLGAAVTQNPTLQKVAVIGAGVNGIVNDLNAKTWVRAAAGTHGAVFDPQTGQSWKQVRMPGGVFNAVGTGLGAAAQLTGNPVVGAASQVATGVGDTMRAAHFGGAGAGIATGFGAALGLAGSFIKGTAGKVVNAASVALTTAGSILSKATSLAGGIVGGVAGVAGALIGGETGRKISAGASIAMGAMMMAANPVLGVLGIVGGLLGLFGGKKKVSKYSEQMAADFKGDGKADDVMVRAAKGKNNNLEIRLTDEKTGKSNAVQTIAIGGWFNKKEQSRQAQTVDVNGDGKSDIVWQDKNRVSVFVNRGDGTFGNADYAKERGQLKAEGDELRNWGKLVQSLGPRESSGRGGRMGFNDGALLQSFNRSGGKDKLGDFGTWSRRVRQEGNLDKLRQDFKAGGGAEKLGPFAQYVAQRLQSLGVAAPSKLGQMLAESASASAPARRGSSTDALSQALLAPSNSSSGRWGGRGGYLAAMSLERTVDNLANTHVARYEGQFMGTGSKDASDKGSGVSLATQTFDVQIDKQRPGQLYFWDVNGDGSNDMVFAGEGVKGAKAYLNRGDGRFDQDAIDMEKPSEQDWGQLVLQDYVGRVFLNADFSGDGKNRMQALFTGEQWVTLQQPAPSEPRDDKKRNA